MEELTVFENELADKATFVIHLLNCIHKVKGLVLFFGTSSPYECEINMSWNKAVRIMLR